MNKLKMKLFEYGWIGKVLWIIIILNIVSFIIGIVYNIVAWVWMIISGLIFKKKTDSAKMNPWDNEFE